MSGLSSVPTGTARASQAGCRISRWDSGWPAASTIRPNSRCTADNRSGCRSRLITWMSVIRSRPAAIVGLNAIDCCTGRNARARRKNECSSCRATPNGLNRFIAYPALRRESVFRSTDASSSRHDGSSAAIARRRSNPSYAIPEPDRRSRMPLLTRKLSSRGCPGLWSTGFQGILRIANKLTTFCRAN